MPGQGEWSGYAISLTLAALRAAVEERPAPGCIHHSDRGGQYAADLYRKALAELDCEARWASRDNPYDNAKAESFMKTLKCEYVYLNEYRHFAEVVERVAEFIDQVYNTRRSHSALGYLPPVQFEERHRRQLVQSPA